MWGGRGGQLCVWKVISRNHTQKYPLQYPSCARQMVWRIGPVSRAVRQSISLFGYDLDKWLDRLVVNDHCHTSGQPNSRTNQLQYSANMLELSFDRTQARTTIVVLTMPGAALVFWTFDIGMFHIHWLALGLGLGLDQMIWPILIPITQYSYSQ